jgi:hypothetical protein
VILNFFGDRNDPASRKESAATRLRLRPRPPATDEDLQNPIIGYIPGVAESRPEGVSAKKNSHSAGKVFENLFGAGGSTER